MNTVEPVLATTWQKRPPKNCGHTISVPSIPGFKCTECVLENRPPEKCELRTPKVGPKRRFNLQKATTYVKLSKKHFFVCRTFPSQALWTSDHRVCKLRLAWSLPITPPLTRGNQRSLMSWLAQGHVYNSILKVFEPNLANETTWKMGPLTPSPFSGHNSQVWLYKEKFFTGTLVVTIQIWSEMFVCRT